MIDIDEIGADWELASVHAKTTVAGKTPGGVDEVERCPCCFRSIVTQPIGLFQNSKELQVLGFAYPLYFKFLKYSMILILFEIGTYNIPLLFNSISFNQQQCSDQSTAAALGYICESFLIKIANVAQTVTISQTVSRICSFFIQLFLLIYIRHKMSNTLKYYGQRRTVISNYSILIKDLPEVLGIKEKIKRLFSQFFSCSHFTQEIILISFLSEYYDLKQKKNKLVKQKIKLMGQSFLNQDLIKANDLQITKVQVEIDYQIQKTIALNKKDQLLCQKVIVILQTEQSKQNVIRQFQSLSAKPEKRQELRNIFGCDDVDRIRMQSAPEPQEIIWEHINTPRKKRRIKQILGWVFTTMFMGVLTLIFYFILKEKSYLVSHYLSLIDQSSKDKQGSDANSYKVRAEALVYIYIFLIVLLNKFVISKFLHFVSVFERHPTYSKEEYFFSLKYTITLFLTTAVLTIVVQDFTFHNIYHQKYGIIEEQSIMFMVSSFFVPLIWLINPLQISRTFKRKKQLGSQVLTQREANQLMMDEPASLGKLFSETIETIWFTYMYSSIIPAGGILVLVGLAINYWVVKFNILRRSSIDHQVSGKFIMMALSLLDFSLIMKPVGQILFDTQIRVGSKIQSVICASIGLGYWLLPIQWILQQVHKQEFLLQEKTYEEARHNFTNSYQMLHPIYSLKKIYVERELQRFKLYQLKGQAEERRPTKKLPISIELALMRRSSQFKLQSRLASNKQPHLEKNTEQLPIQNEMGDALEQETSGY